MSIPAQGAVGAETMTAGQSLDLRDLHAANIARQAEWCPDQVPDLSFRGNELGGECGEAQNVIKKLERERQGWRGSRATKDDLADELADVVICADLCAVTADIDLGAAVRRKFNATSEKQGLSVFLPLPALASPRADSDERTAGEDGDLSAAIDVIDRCLKLAHDNSLDTMHVSGSPRHWKAVLAKLREAAPAQPAGAVPDSLRALSEAASQGEWSIWREPILSGEEAVRELTLQVEQTSPLASHLYLLNANGKCPATTGCGPTSQANANFIVAAVNFVRTLLATHPAGQSAGSGAEDAGLKDAIAEIVRRAEKDQTFLRRTLARMRAEQEPAPDSTRTGQGVAETATEKHLREALTVAASRMEVASMDWGIAAALASDKLTHADDMDRWAKDARAALVARPAAPEAQGADADLIDAVWPFAACVFNDNGDITLSTGRLTDHDWVKLDRAHRRALTARQAAQGAWRSQAADDVLAERRRQVEVEGWTPEHDDTHSRCEIASAAACYATAPSPIRIEREWTYPDAPANWPWCRSWWKPGFYRRNLVKAAALLIAEIERWDRLPAPPASSGQGGR